MKPSQTPSRITLAGLAAGIVLGLVIALVVRTRWGNSTPQLTLQAYLAALERWNEEAPANYDVLVEVRGSQPATYFVQVRQGEARSAFRNQNYLPQLRSHETWSVDGMFATLAEDVQRMSESEKEGAGMPFHLRVDFDPQYGFPAFYQRTEYNAPIVVEWNVREFLPVPEGTPWQTSYADTHKTAKKNPAPE